MIVVDSLQTVDSGSPKVYMMSDHSSEDQQEGGNELNVVAEEGDTIVWRAVPINQTDEIDLMDFVFRSGTVLINPKLQPDGSWKGWVNKKGQEIYHFKFKIGEHGPYEWDPYITVAS